MIFKKICIQNLFSYYGEQVFDFPSPTQKRPVILIAGRNGFGKTSFINSVKLLFLGTADEMLRNVQAGMTLRPNSYLLGTGKEWQGIFNRRARHESLKEKRFDTRYGITIEWLEPEGKVIAERYWTLRRNDPEAHLRIETNFDTDLGRVIEDPESAEEFLERRLPKSLVPFFFYDGEQVQQIAEANREGQLRQIERLLDISALDTLNAYLQKIINSWRLEGQGPEARAELAQLKAELQALQADIAAKQALIADADADIDNVSREIRRIERQSDALRAKSLQRDEPRLKSRLAKARENYEEICGRVAENLTPAAPLWACPELLKSVGDKLALATNNNGHILADELSQIAELIPRQLFDMQPHSTPSLSEAQKLHYKGKLARLFAVYTESPSGGFFSLKAAETITLKELFDYYRQASTERQRHAEDLKNASLLRREIADLKAELDTLDNISPEEQKLFQARQEDLNSQTHEREKLIGQRAIAANDVQSLENKLRTIEGEIRTKETEVVKKDINSSRIERARQAQRMFDSYKQGLKASQRERIQEAVNRRFKSLMTSHGMIANIEMDEDFALTYRDASGSEVGMANISAGMKQLTAQALLWALSETTTRHIPIIVDTPLARIDRDHQKNLLKNYYPCASEQMIVLPTDSEIDQEKYRLLKPHICKEFQLKNTDGDHTEVHPDVPMYQPERA